MQTQRYDSLEAFIASTPEAGTALAEIRHKLAALAQANPHHRRPQAIDEQSLARRGIRHLPVEFSYGANSIAIPITNRRQILKISLGNRQDGNLASEDAPMLLSPLHAWQDNGLKFQVFPEVQVLDNKDPEAWKHVQMMDRLCLKAGYLFWDMKPENLGLLSNGACVIIDDGAVTRIDDLFTVRGNQIVHREPLHIAAGDGRQFTLYDLRRHYQLEGAVPVTESDMRAFAGQLLAAARPSRQEGENEESWSKRLAAFERMAAPVRAIDHHDNTCLPLRLAEKLAVAMHHDPARNILPSMPGQKSVTLADIVSCPDFWKINLRAEGASDEQIARSEQKREAMLSHDRQVRDTPINPAEPAEIGGITVNFRELERQRQKAVAKNAPLATIAVEEANKEAMYLRDLRISADVSRNLAGIYRLAQANHCRAMGIDTVRGLAGAMDADPHTQAMDAMAKILTGAGARRSRLMAIAEERRLKPGDMGHCSDEALRRMKTPEEGERWVDLIHTVATEEEHKR